METHKPGVGLGLYIFKGLVEAHGGRIWAESEPGKSTTFHFRLPFHAHDAVRVPLTPASTLFDHS